MSIVVTERRMMNPPPLTLYDTGVTVNLRLFALTFLAALWIWKAAEYAAREVGLLERNLGWGFYVNLTVAPIVTFAFLSILALRRIARWLVR